MIGFLLAITLTTAAAAVWRRHRYARAFRIPATRDDAFTFRNGESFAIELDARGFSVAESPVPGSSVFLELELHSTLGGRLFDPHVEHVAGRQFFERGLNGRRYLNLTPVFATSPRTRVDLRRRHLRWARTARMHVFQAPNLLDRARLVIAPHPDDAELAAFGLYANAPSFVLTISAGERSRASDDSARHAAERVEASLTIPLIGRRGREDCANLVFPDARLQALHDDRTRVCELGCESRLPRRRLRALNSQPELAGGDAACRWSDLVAEIAAIIRLRQPDVLVCPHPILDAHPDHVYAAVAAAEALAQCGHRPSLVLLYTVHALNASLHPFGDRGSWTSLPPGSPVRWISDSVYSHPLSDDVRAAKHRAIELAPDLRTPVAQGLRAALAAGARRCSAWVSGMPLDPADLLRRHSRPDEIYFQVSAQGFAELAERAAAGESPVHARRAHRATSQRDWVAEESSIAELLEGNMQGSHRDQLLARLYDHARAVVAAARDAGPIPVGEAAMARAAWLERPIFVCGHHRTGTTLLQELLDGHPQLVVLPSEGTYFDSFSHVTTANPDAAALNRFAAEWVARFIDPNFAPHFRLGRATSGGSPAFEFTRRFFGWFGALQGRPPFRMRALLALVAAYSDIIPSVDPVAWVEKTPLNEHHVRRLAQMPHARFIQLVRHPDRALVSLRQAYARGGLSAEFDVAVSSAALGNSLRIAKLNARHFTDRYLIVRYEDLLADTRGEMERVREFIGIAPSATLLTPTAGGIPVAANSSFEAGKPGEVRETASASLTAKERRLIDSLAGDAARALGYPIARAGVVAAAGVRLQHAWPLARMRVRDFVRNSRIAR